MVAADKVAADNEPSPVLAAGSTSAMEFMDAVEFDEHAKETEIHDGAEAKNTEIHDGAVPSKDAVESFTYVPTFITLIAMDRGYRLVVPPGSVDDALMMALRSSLRRRDMSSTHSCRRAC